MPVLVLPGRRTGKLRHTPVTPLDLDGQRYLVAGFPGADWAANARCRRRRHPPRRAPGGPGPARRARPRRRRAGPAGLAGPPVPQGAKIMRDGGVVADLKPDTFAALAGRCAVFRVEAVSHGSTSRSRAHGRTTCATSRCACPSGRSPRSSACPAPASRRWCSTRSPPRPSAELNETFSTFVRGFLPKLGQPDADLITNLSTAIVVDQRRLGGGSRSTLGTVTDVNALLRLLWSRRSTPHVGAGFAFSFNEPQGMCRTVPGRG